MSATNFYYVALAFSCLVAFSNWRQAIYLAILLDFVRDPVRKLDPDQSVFITVSVLGLWAAITVSAYGQSQGVMTEAKQQHPRVFQALRLMVYAIIPGALISMLLYSAGYKMVLLGAVSYLAPAAGIMLGYLLGSDEKSIARILRFYCIVNGLALTSVIAEYAGLGWPLLGGLRGMVWIRYSGHDIVDLIGGFYRSPDIMGLHAAQVVMFALTLSIQKQRSWSPVWIAFALLGSLCLLLSGRRKMLGMPMVFMASLLLFSYRRGIQNYQLKVIPILATLGIVGGLYMISTDTYVGSEYANYASTLFSDGADRYRALVGDSVVTTVAQSGVLGGGLGSATQGAYHFVGNQKGSWQEDGVSRVFRELGVVGVLFVLAAGWTLVQGIVSAVRRTPKQLRIATLQLCLLSIVLANLASFSISHQQYSGDPPSAIFVLIMLGMALGISPAVMIGLSRDGRPERPLRALGRPSRPVVKVSLDE
jgi:hypothetical protein